MAPRPSARHAASSASRAVATSAPNAGLVADREVGEDLAVDVDLGALQAGDEPRVRDVVLTTRGVDAHDPQPAELALACAAVAEGVVARSA